MDPWLLSFTKLADQRAAIGSSVSCRALPLRGLLSTVCLGTGRVYTSCAGTAVEEGSLRPAPYSKSQLVRSFLLPGR